MILYECHPLGPNSSGNVPLYSIRRGCNSNTLVVFAAMMLAQLNNQTSKQFFFWSNVFTFGK